MGYPTFVAGDAGRLPVELLAEVLAGEGGRLAAAFSDDRTLACRASARVPGAAAPGYLAVTVTCPPARLDAAVTAVRAAIARVASVAITPDEVNRAARRLIGVRAAALRTRMAVADALVRDEAYGLPMLAYRRVPAALARVAAADVARAAQPVLDPKREIIAVVHPPSAAPALARTAAEPGPIGGERASMSSCGGCAAEVQLEDTVLPPLRRARHRSVHRHRRRRPLPHRQPHRRRAAWAPSTAPSTR